MHTQCQSCGAYSGGNSPVLPCENAKCGQMICSRCRSHHKSRCDEMTKLRNAGLGATVRTVLDQPNDLPEIPAIDTADHSFDSEEERQNSKPPALGAGYGLGGGELYTNEYGDEVRGGLWGYALQVCGVDMPKELAAEIATQLGEAATATIPVPTEEEAGATVAADITPKGNEPDLISETPVAIETDGTEPEPQE